MNGRSGMKVRYDKDFEKQCYELCDSQMDFCILKNSFLLLSMMF